jgi:hypothetical protein
MQDFIIFKIAERSTENGKTDNLTNNPMSLCNAWDSKIGVQNRMVRTQIPEKP